ncbi:MAG TPA: hypothetical protein VHE30_04360 [Polyangiaceae bacterium]|nr:hypothetical protein [Polyangiaceae bacterium]
MSARFGFVVLFLGLASSACGSSKKTPTPSAQPTDTAEEDSAPPPAPPECKDPTDVKLYGVDPTGLVNCNGADGRPAAAHRKEAIDCPSKLPRATKCGADPVGDAAPTAPCRTDQDCTAKPIGYCTANAKSASCYCDYGCVKDSDCGDGYLCQCGDPVGTCVHATCHTDADCGGSLLCLRSLDENCNFVYSCQKPTDPCTVSSDCPALTPACQVVNGERKCGTTTACH